MRNNKPRVSIKIIFKQGVVKRVASRKIRRINHFIEANNFENCVVEVSVAYGSGFYNKGVYKTKIDLVFALKAFLENGLL